MADDLPAAAIAIGLLHELRHGAARELRQAAAALYVAAERFRNLGLGMNANRAYMAGKAAEQAADNLNPAPEPIRDPERAP